MRSNTYTYDIAIRLKDGSVVMSSGVAGSKWEAEDRAHTKFIFQQPDRSAYKAKRSYANARRQIGGVL